MSLLIGVTCLMGLQAQAQLRCFEAQRSQAVEKRQQVTEVRDLKTFGQAMTEGMLLRPDQPDLFEIYRKIFLGDPNVTVDGKTLKSVTDLLEKYPDLEKRHFQEFEISVVEKNYSTPDSLAKFIKAQTAAAGQVRNNLFQIDANLDFWKKVLDYRESIPENLKPLYLGKGATEQDKARAREINKARAEFQNQAKLRFIKYLNRIISKTNRDLLADLKNENTAYYQKAKALFETLKYISSWMEKNGRNTQAIRQAMLDLVYTIGYGKQATQSLLKSERGLDKIQGLNQLWSEADRFAEELKYPGHFAELKEKLQIEFPTGLSKNEDIAKIIQNLENEVLAGTYTMKSSEITRVRSLSIQESPFRSCLGSDCSTRTYFDKALDPNYIYFTMTDSNHHSGGYATLVLGTALNPETKQLEQVAFLDKLQNIPTQKIELFLNAVSRSLATQDYKLAIPTDLGKDLPGHGGLSNMDVITDFVQMNILPRLSQVRASFTPHPHQYSFKNSYSRGDQKLEVRIFQAKPLEKGVVEVKPGKNYAAYAADNKFDKSRLIQDLIDLRDSPQEQDVLKYISSGPMIAQLEKLGLFSQKEFMGDLRRIVNESNRSYQIRRQAFYEILLLSNKSDDNTLPDFQSTRFSEAEKAQMVSEVKQWSKSSDKRKKQFSDGIQSKWFAAILTGNETIMKFFLALKWVDINQKNARGYSALTVAVQKHQVKVIHLLLADPRINILEADNKGFTVLDHALALGHQDLVALIKEKRPDVKWSGNEKTASRVHQTMDFIRVAPGTFKMGDAGVQTTISKPVDIMSTLLTQKMYFKIMGKNPSKFQDGENTVTMKVGNELQKLQPDNPVEQVSYENGVQLLKKINELSKRDAPLLYELIPGHTLGAQYDFITEAQIEYVMKKAKTEDGDTIDEMIKRNDIEKLKQYTVFSDNSGSTTQPVGSKKPLFLDGKPIHDLNGNVWVWIKDWWQSLSGGTDPQGANSGSVRVLRGGSWYSNAKNLRSALRHNSVPGFGTAFIGLRLVRKAP